MNTVATADHGRQSMAAGFGGDGLAEFFEISQQKISRADHLNRKSGIDYVAAGQSKVQPATRRLANVFSDVGGKSDDIMIEHPLELLTPLDAECRPAFHLGQIFFRDEPFPGKRFGRQQLDLQPELELL